MKASDAGKAIIEFGKAVENLLEAQYKMRDQINDYCKELYPQNTPSFMYDLSTDSFVTTNATDEQLATIGNYIKSKMKGDCMFTLSII